MIRSFEGPYPDESRVGRLTGTLVRAHVCAYAISPPQCTAVGRNARSITQHVCALTRVDNPVAVGRGSDFLETAAYTIVAHRTHRTSLTSTRLPRVADTRVCSQTSCFCAAQFLTAYCWGLASDRIGRKVRLSDPPVPPPGALERPLSAVSLPSASLGLLCSTRGAHPLQQQCHCLVG